MMSERIGSRGWRIWKEKNLPQEVVPLSDAEGVASQLEEKLDKKTKDFRAFREARIGYDYITRGEILEAEIAALKRAGNRVRNAEKDCIALRNWQIGFEDWADVEELKTAWAGLDALLATAFTGGTTPAYFSAQNKEDEK